MEFPFAFPSVLLKILIQYVYSFLYHVNGDFSRHVKIDFV